MRRIRGGVDDQVSGEVQGGDWGVVDGLPPALADGLAVKNGWTLKHDGWHIASLAIHPEWVLAITMRKPGSLSSAADACASVARRLVVVRPKIAGSQTGAQPSSAAAATGGELGAVLARQPAAADPGPRTPPGRRRSRCPRRYR
jgi:hypothetical protein